MAQDERPGLYLITPAEIELSTFSDRLKAVLDAEEVACLRIALASRDEDRLGRAADQLRDIAHARDVAIVIDDHLGLAERHGLDGVHLTTGGKGVRYARKELGPDAIVGAFCGASRHDGMSAGEAGSDYVAFGPLSGAALGDGTLADEELFHWWSELIELPVVAEGGLDVDMVRSLAPYTDFFALGDEIWGTEDPLAALRRFTAVMG
ncbi:thiamine phosphate synthase [Mesobacterium pallidum]|uniref:thiamine phosphate synthase n=1 Tax=Mesobacterium pallidum TaxID=2872037 RepID=UPI001EE266A0|nr:thiamine phosphate synthase [Mesobacterium pallidum]